MKKGLHVILKCLMFFFLVSLGIWYIIYNTPQKHEEDEEDIENTILPTKVSISISSPPKTLPNGWKLIWNDEFDDLRSTLKKWTFEDMVAEKNNELQYYSPTNVKTADGLLTLIAKDEKARGRNFTSGAVHTKNTFNFSYGKVEMKARLPSGQGMFPAFWMMTNKEDTWLPEINILEMLGQEPHGIWMVLHGLDENNQKKTVFQSYEGENYSASFHTFSLEWTPTQLTWLIDDEIKFETNEYIPNEEMYLYINTAIGGDWPGSPDDTTQFPTFYEIDYVRVYQKVGAN